jgi:2,3-bisphosphoglycerate-dependent phosphoglycerate mutase
MKKESILILMRHGQSLWNERNLFTGWVDVPLSKKGIEESIKGGESIKDIPIDCIFTSTLIRGQMTAFLAMLSHKSGKVPVFKHPKEGKLDKWAKIYSKETEKETIPVFASWHLNERMYGQLQGLNKDEMRRKYGEEQVQIWRRSYDVAPPSGESLHKTAKRTIPYFRKNILPRLNRGENVFIAAHGNSLRSIIMDLESLSKDDVVRLELTTGRPIIYRFFENRLEKLTEKA